jgi:hypothetical protein
MNKSATTQVPMVLDSQQKEKIIFDIQPLLLPTILNLENMTMIGFTVIIFIAAVAFHFGISEFIIVAVLYLLIAVPALNSIFRAGSTSYVLTNRRLLIFTVGVRQKERSIPLEQISGVQCKSSGFQRFYGAGDVIVYQKTLRRPVKLLGLKVCKKRAEQIMQSAKIKGK